MKFHNNWALLFYGLFQFPIIAHHREQVKPSPQFNTLTELASWFQQQKTEIESLPIAGRLRRMLIESLNVTNNELARDLLDRQ
jgi:hypothetical protein